MKSTAHAVLTAARPVNTLSTVLAPESAKADAFAEMALSEMTEEVAFQSPNAQE
jgi:hypothetical protein